MNIQPLPDGLGLHEDAARVMADGLRTQIGELQARLREAETHLERLTITRKTVTALADRVPAQTASPDLPERPDYPRILAVFNEAAGPLRARDVCEALDHDCCRRTSKAPAAERLVKLDILTEVDTGSFTRKQ
ncbi:hypothetical protein ACFTXJ_00725 [Streptomyces zhihengii]|uniref:hypothetical protein n=1 Tax=Streptomyces zhihengii TaxID=1818004 RepID=UPI00363DC72A